MYLHIGRNQMLAERRIIGIFDLEITSQSKTTRAFLDRAQQEHDRFAELLRENGAEVV